VVPLRHWPQRFGFYERRLCAAVRQIRLDLRPHRRDLGLRCRPDRLLQAPREGRLQRLARGALMQPVDVLSPGDAAEFATQIVKKHAHPGVAGLRIGGDPDRVPTGGVAGLERVLRRVRRVRRVQMRPLR